MQGCGGDLADWVHGVNELLTDEGVLQNGSEFTEYYTFQHEGLTNILFSMDHVDLDIGRLAVWRIQTHEVFGGYWLSDYLPNKFGVEVGELAPTPAPETEEAPPDYALKAYIEHPYRPNDGGFSMPLPASREMFEPFLKHLRINDVHNVKVGEIYSIHDGDNNLSYWLNEVLRNMESTKSLDELNYLATKIYGMNEEQREIFAAAIQAEWSTATIGQMIILAENLDCYHLEPAACNAEIYGEFCITTEQDETADSFYRLKESKDPEDQRLAKLIERLEQCVDRGVYGQMIAKEEGGALTDYGYLQQVKEMDVKYHGIGDIPLELRISKPTLMEMLQHNRQKSREQFGTQTPPAQNRESEEVDL